MFIAYCNFCRSLIIKSSSEAFKKKVERQKFILNYIISLNLLYYR